VPGHPCMRDIGVPDVLGALAALEAVLAPVGVAG
jgi:hypothetical protein